MAAEGGASASDDDQLAHDIPAARARRSWRSTSPIWRAWPRCSIGWTGGPAFYKVGLELFVAEGERAIEAVRARGGRVFLDLKLHDIPETVARAVASAARIERRAADRAHLGRLRDAVARGRGGGGPGQDPRRHGADQPGRGRSARRGRRTDRSRRWSRARARIAARAGIAGLVCSPQEIGAARGAAPRPAHRRPRHPSRGRRGRGAGRSEARRDRRAGHRGRRRLPGGRPPDPRRAPIRRPRSKTLVARSKRRCERRGVGSSSASAPSRSWSAPARARSASSTSPRGTSRELEIGRSQAAKERRISVEMRPRGMVAELARRRRPPGDRRA